MKKADGNLYFRRLFVYILIPFFAGGRSPAGCPRPRSRCAPRRRRQSAAAGKEYGPPCCLPSGGSSAVSCRSRHTSLSSSASFPSLSSIGLRLCCILRSISVRSAFRAVSSGSLRQELSTTSRRTGISFSSSSFFFPEFLQCRLDGRERVDEVHRRQSRVGGDIPVVILV